MTHTPGPWWPEHNDHYWEIKSEAHLSIGDACASNHIYVEGKELPREQVEPIAAANARLMAAAPELLEVCEDLWCDFADTFDPALRKIADRARAAIAKATGKAA